MVQLQFHNSSAVLFSICLSDNFPYEAFFSFFLVCHRYIHFMAVSRRRRGHLVSRRDLGGPRANAGSFPFRATGTLSTEPLTCVREGWWPLSSPPKGSVDIQDTLENSATRACSLCLAFLSNTFFFFFFPLYISLTSLRSQFLLPPTRTNTFLNSLDAVSVPCLIYRSNYLQRPVGIDVRVDAFSNLPRLFSPARHTLSLGSKLFPTIQDNQ